MKKGNTYTGIVERVDFPNKGIVVVETTQEDGTVKKDENGEGTGIFYVYLPEYQNIDGDGNELTSAAKMFVSINDKDYLLEFKFYADNTPFNIVRNHYYQYKFSLLILFIIYKQ